MKNVIIAALILLSIVGCASSKNKPAQTTYAPYPSPSVYRNTTVYVTITGKKYHRNGCRYLNMSKIPISLEYASRAYEPCLVCNP